MQNILGHIFNAFVDDKPITERFENGREVICVDLGALITARAREFRICWRWLNSYSLEGCVTENYNSQV